MQLRGVHIAGRLDLYNLTTGVGVELLDCLLSEGLVARGATLPFLVLSGCRWSTPPRRRWSPTHSLLRGWFSIRRTIYGRFSEDPTVSLADAHLGLLNCTGAMIRNESGPALHADGLRVDGDVYLLGARFQAIGAGEDGAVRLLGAHLGGLDCTDATIRNNRGPALAADDLRVDRSVFLRGGFEAVGVGGLGAVRLPGAHVTSRLECTDARMRNDSGPALRAESLRVDQDVFLDGGFEAVGVGEDGAVRLIAAHVGGQLDCTTRRSATTPAQPWPPTTSGLDRDVQLRGLKAFGAGELGAIRLLGAHLGSLQDRTDASMCKSRAPPWPPAASGSTGRSSSNGSRLSVRATTTRP